MRAYRAELLARPGDYMRALNAAFQANRDAGGAKTKGQHVKILQEAGLGRGAELGTEAGAIPGGGQGVRKWWIPRM